MLKDTKILFCFVLLITLLACSRAYNYKDAEGITVSGQHFIKLKGKRKLMAHDISAFFNKTYEDSILISVPSLKDGIVKAEEIPAKEGYYKYLGELSIKGNILEVNLSYDNTDDKKIELSAWNGQYKLTRK